MLSPSSPTQKNLSEEDSSGSDAGSEVSLEPETDRFGFILANGSTAGSLGPPPELVRQREAKWINIIQQWDRILLKKASKVKVQCQKGIPASLRAKCWPLLCGATDRMKENEKLYQTLDSQPALQSWVDVIERDLDRQFPFHEMFLSKDGHGQRGLFRVLKAYTQYQPEEGYCQAQGPVTAVLLMNMPAEEAFWCLVQISEQYLPGYYSPLLEGVLFDAAMLSWVLKRTCPAAHKHLQQHGVEPLMFATDWLMCLFTRHLPFNTLLRVWDLFFCYGVRVLLQVAVVLVRRVLGRADQRKQCQGQMETLEKLRGVREQVQEEDDTFIAEVCSVPLSARDLEKQTAKELEKWRKDKPSSTFDPRGRCHGFHMAWARAHQKKEERDRKEREKGNLSVPIARSASTLSLSPTLLRKKWKRGGKVNAGEWEGGGKVVRHLSMGAKEDWNSWTDLNFEKVQGVQEEEDVISEECKKQREPNLTGQMEDKEPLKTDKIQNIPTVHIEEPVIVNEQTEIVETRISEQEGNILLSQHTEGADVGTELNQDLIIDQTVENTHQPNKQTSEHEQGEELVSCSESQVEEQQNHQGRDQEMEVEDINEETGEQVVVESEDTAAVQGNQSEAQKDDGADTNTENLQVSGDLLIQAGMKPEEGTETNNIQQRQVDTESSETRTETSPTSEAESNTKAIPVTEPHFTTETQQQQQEEVITATDTSSPGDVFESKCHSPESLAGTEIEETHTQTETRSDVLTHTLGKAENAATQNEGEIERVQRETEQHIDSNLETTTEAETLIRSSPECSQQDECTDIVSEPEGEAETPPTHDIEASEAFAQCSEKECDRAACELTHEQEERFMMVHSEEKVESDHTQTEETPTETQTKVEDPDSVTPQQKEEVVEFIITKSQQRMSSVETTSEEPESEQRASQVTMADTENDKESTVGEDTVIIATPNVTDNPHSEEVPQVQDQESTVGADTVISTPNVTEDPHSEEVPQVQDQESTVGEDTVFISTPNVTDDPHSEDIPQVKDQESTVGEDTVFISTPNVMDDLHSEDIPQVEDQGSTVGEDTVISTPSVTDDPHSEEVPQVQDQESDVGADTVISTPNVTDDPHSEDVPQVQDQESTVGEDAVFISTPKVTDDPHSKDIPQVQDKESSQADPNAGDLTQISRRRSSRSSGDFCVRKSSTSHGSRLARKLSEDLFTSPQKTSQSQSSPNHPDVQQNKSQSSPQAVNKIPPEVTQSSQVKSPPSTLSPTEGAVAPQDPQAPPKRFGLFRRLRGEQPKKAKEKGTQKMQVPKILIQDFSDGTGKPVEEEDEEKLSSRERRRRRRERERREKEEERLKKKKEKELEKEKERERRKPQTRGKSFQVQKEKGSDNVPHLAKTGSKTLRHSATYAESYF
uniref:Rab-GAP TBC domain-containing protein n=1 Tax=Anabas testudineus TaxID=64144 RepID=A0AAQ6I8E9_ANATE